MIVDELKETNSIQQLTTGLMTFLSIRTNLMKLYENNMLEFIQRLILFIGRYEQISTAVKRNEHNVRLETFLEEIVLISQTNMSSLNISVFTSICRLLK